MEFMGNSKLSNSTISVWNITDLKVRATNIALNPILDDPVTLNGNLGVFGCQTYKVDVAYVKGNLSLRDANASSASVTLLVDGGLIIENNTKFTALNLTPSVPVTYH